MHFFVGNITVIDVNINKIVIHNVIYSILQQVVSSKTTSFLCAIEGQFEDKMSSVVIFIDICWLDVRFFDILN